MHMNAIFFHAAHLPRQNPANPYQHFYFHSGQLWVVSNLLEPLLRHGEEIDTGKKEKNRFPQVSTSKLCKP